MLLFGIRLKASMEVDVFALLVVPPPPPLLIAHSVVVASSIEILARINSSSTKCRLNFDDWNMVRDRFLMDLNKTLDQE
jgi:hypothetical protein